MPTFLRLAEATNGSLVLVRAATWGARRMWRDGYRYSKAGVITVDLVRLAASQRAMPGLGQFGRERGAALMGPWMPATRDGGAVADRAHHDLLRRVEVA